MSEKDIDLIEGFFERTLTEKELNHVQARLENDPNFETQVANYEFALQTATTIYMPEKTAAEAQLRKDWKKQYDESLNHKSPFIFKRKYLTIAASFLLIIAASWWIYQNSSSIELSSALTKQALEMENFDINERGDTHSLKALQAYKNRAYHQVIALTAQIDQKDIEQQLLRGRAFVQTQSFEQAIPYFEQVIQQKHIKQDEAIWNLALIYFELKAFEKCKFHLNSIIENDFGTKAKAKVFLKQIEQQE